MPFDAEQLHAVMRRIGPHIRRTPLVPVRGGGFVKLEALQAAGSFKVRGFFAAALRLEPDQRARGLLTVSAGNAALACAYVARRLDIPCRVVMYDSAPLPKVEGVRALGAEVTALPRAAVHEWMISHGWEREHETFIHPFADEDVMSGHATIALEVLEDLPDVQRILVPVGGGGLVCGIADGFAALRRGVEVLGVQSDGYPMWPRAFATGGPVALTPDTIADGTTAPFDPRMFERLGARVREWVVVPEGRLRSAVARLAIEVKVVAEGAGALSYAALTDGRTTEHTVAVVSGGNIDARRLAELLTEPTSPVRE